MNSEEYLKLRKDEIDRRFEDLQREHQMNAAILEVQLVMMRYSMMMQTVGAMMLNPNVKDDEIIRAMKILSGEEDA